MEELLRLVQNKSDKADEHAKILVKVDACVDRNLISGKETSPELEILEDAELAAAQALKRAEDALINYQPTSAQEYGLQTCAIIGTFADNENEPSLRAVRRGAKALASGGLK